MPQARRGRMPAKRGGGLSGEAMTGGLATSEQPGAGVPFIAAFIDDGGKVAVDRIADSFGMSKSQLAETVGLGREALYKPARVRAVKIQGRLKEMLEIISLISAWAGGKDQAMAWYRAQPIAAFGNRTAESLVKSGNAGAVRDYLDHLAMGGFA